MNLKNKEILLLDDIEENIHLLNATLADSGYKIRATTDPVFALKAVFKNPPSLMLVDVQMPELDGFTFCQLLKQNPKTARIPVIFVTASDDVKTITKAFDVGGSDYITKPFKAEEVLSRVRTHLRLYDYEQTLAEKISQGTTKIRHLNTEIEDTQRELIAIMGNISEERSAETGKHVQRVAEYAYLLATLSGEDQQKCDLIKSAAPMHDLGKIAIPDAILHKKGRLTDEEMRVMKTHASLGHKMLSISKRPMLQKAALIALEHHECYDGSGYPKGLKGEDISLAGRVTAIADVFDALSSKRCYKEPWDIEKVLSYIKEKRGQQFDPKLVDLMFDNLDQFFAISERLMD